MSSASEAAAAILGELPTAPCHQESAWCVLREQGDRMFVKEDFGASAEAFTDALSLLPLSDTTSRSDLLARRAAAFVRAGKLPQALWDAELVIKGRGGGDACIARAMFVRAMVRRDRGDFAGGEADLVSALAAPTWSEESKEMLEAALIDVRTGGKKFRLKAWMSGLIFYFLDMLVWNLLPMITFSMVWMLICLYFFSTLMSSGEISTDASRVEMSTALGLVAATVLWGWWLQEEERRSKESNGRYLTVREQLAGFWIAVRVFGLFSASRLLISAATSSREAEFGQLKQDIRDIQEQVGHFEESKVIASKPANRPSSSLAGQGAASARESGQQAKKEAGISNNSDLSRNEDVAVKSKKEEFSMNSQGGHRSDQSPKHVAGTKDWASAIVAHSRQDSGIDTDSKRYAVYLEKMKERAGLSLSPALEEQCRSSRHILRICESYPTIQSDFGRR